ncbi:NAD-dependent epimerase/dehydratase family protein [Frigidibacter sp. MR17.24]|uniref:NAD-dependent epimerase/dehydratase family protein n=1 Tax=Frigidibacter sp. MR17.24 TaxID=3127345 RepID=UPI003012D0EB
MLKKLLITGAAGGLGRAMRTRLGGVAETLRLADIVPVEDPGPTEEVVTCDLADAAAVRAMVAGCDGIVHFGGKSVEGDFGTILNANILGLYNLYEAARAEGVGRVLFASSNHTIGFYRQDEWLKTTDPMRPDGLYGVSKCFGEALASMYHDKFGIETAIVRIGSCFEEPANHRMLATWMSFDDCAALIGCVFRAPRLGCPVIWGVSDNDQKWWDTASAAAIGWRPQDNSERFRAALDARMERPAKDHPNAVYQGGMFTQEPIHGA